MLMLVFKIVLNILLGVLFQGLPPMKIVRPLTTKHRDFGITISVDNQNRILVGLSVLAMNPWKCSEGTPCLDMM